MYLDNVLISFVVFFFPYVKVLIDVDPLDNLFVFAENNDQAVVEDVNSYFLLATLVNVEHIDKLFYELPLFAHDWLTLSAILLLQIINLVSILASSNVRVYLNQDLLKGLIGF